MAKKTQIGLRLDNDLLEDIEYLAGLEGVDKMSWIRRALANFVDNERDSMTKEAIEDYIKLGIEEKELLDLAGFKKIPSDIKEARKQYLKKISGGKG